MRNRVLKLSLLLAVMVALTTDVDAQQKKPVRAKSKRATTTKTTNRSKNGGNTTALAAPAKDTVPAAPPPLADITIEPPKKSLRNDNAIERNLVKEKMNLPFVYKADGDYGNQRFIMILLNALKNDSLVAFDATVDDRFTTPITFVKISEQLVGKPRIDQKPDWDKDPDGSKGIMKDTLITEIFNPDQVERYWIKEDVVFDKESSRMYTRILGIAPLKTVLNPDGSFRAVTPIFWVYYPDLRPMLAKYEVYNGKNYGARMSWEELFESRMFASRVIKSTINNPNDLLISAYVKDPILALLEGENIKDKVFNYEQDLWSY